jgi:gliding motility-associated-like protein
MKNKILFLFILLLLHFYQKGTTQNIVVNDQFTAQQLVENVLVNSSCASVRNFTVKGGNFGAGEQSYGYFTNTSPLFALQSGIVLSTGKAKSATGPNSGNISQTIAGWPIDADLEAALNLNNTFDATVLEFDFTPLTNNISFDYIFSSEQYLSNPNPNQCGFTDGFAFLIRPVTSTTYQNIALVPNTTIPVSVNTIRGAGTICPPSNPTYFDAFNGTNHPTTFNGQTKVLKAQSNVIAGQEYHIKLVIADQGNGLFDSAIFLSGGSFQSTVNLGIDRTIANNNPLCLGETITLNATQAGNNNTYKWFKNGQDINISTPILPITETSDTSVSNYSVEVTINGTCVAPGSINIQFAPLPNLVSQSLTQCDDNQDGSSVFNLTSLDNLIKNNDATLSVVSYYETLTGTTPIPNSSAYPSITKTIYAEASTSFGCKTRVPVNLVVNPISIIDFNYEKCDSDSTVDGFTQFDLNTEITNTIIPQPTIQTMAFYKNVDDAIKEINQLPNILTNSVKDLEIIYGRVKNGLDCIALYKIELKVNYIPLVNLADEVKILCKGESIPLAIDPIYSSYTWSTGETNTNEITISNTGNFTVDVTDANGCKGTKKYIVNPSAPATDIDAIIKNFSLNNSIQITYTDNGGNYEFSIDGFVFQDNSFFENVKPGVYTIAVRDKNGCQPTPTKTIYVLDYPKFFTPNNDGNNDVWKIKNIEFTNTIASISVFNRYGKLLKFITPNQGWDGNYLGKPQPADDYWFTLTFTNGDIVKSHFSLKR